jgi:hypothetical protein
MTVPDSCEVPQTDPRAMAGYTFDPYADQCQLGDIHNPNFPFHNYRQIHISEVAFWEGFRAPTPKDIPECPPKWQDCKHYWAIVSLAGYVYCEFSNKGTIAVKVATSAGAVGVYEAFIKPLAAAHGLSLP